MHSWLFTLFFFVFIFVCSKVVTQISIDYNHLFSHDAKLLIVHCWGTVPEIRTALRKDGPVITELGNMVVDVRCDICSFTWVHLTVDARCKLLLFLVPPWPHQVTMKLTIVSNYAYSKISMKHPCLRYRDSDGDDEAICPPYCFKFWFLFLNADLLMVSTTQLNWRTKSTWFLGLLKMVRCLTLKDLESSDHECDIWSSLSIAYVIWSWW